VISETAFRRLLEASPEAMLIVERDGRIDLVNSRLEELFGYPPGELLGQPVEVLVPESRALAHARWRQKFVKAPAIRPMAANREFRCLRKDGSRFPANIGLYPLGARGWTACIVHDLTQRKLDEAVLHDLQEKFLGLFDNAPLAVYFKHLDGRYFLTNKRFEALVGLDGEAIKGKSNVEVYHDEAFSRSGVEHDQEVLATGRASEREEVYQAEDGQRTVLTTKFPVKDQANQVTAIGAIFTDITARKRAEAEVRNRASRQTAIASLLRRTLEGSELSALLQEAVELVAETLQLELCKVLELLPDGSALLLQAGVGWNQGLVGRATVSADLNSQAGYTLACGEPVTVADLRTESRFTGPPLLRDHEVISGVSVIIEGPERPYGILGAFTARERSFTQDDIEFLQSIASLLSRSIEYLRVNEELQRSERRLQEAQHVAHLGNWELDLVNNALFWSDEVYRIFNLKPQDFSANYEAFQDHVHPEDRAMVDKCYWDSVTNRTGYDIVHRIVWGDGTIKFVNERCETFYDDAGKAHRSVGTVQDVSRRVQSEQTIRALANKLERAREVERTRVARDIHDDLGQMLTGLKMDLDWLAGRLPGTDDELQQRLGAMDALIDGGIDSVRRIASSLRPAVLDDLGLAAALEWMTEGFQERSGIRCVLRFTGHCEWSDCAGKELDTAVFRIFEEALTNIARHACAQRVVVRFDCNGSMLELEVADDGVGIAVAALHSPRSVGLTGMRERAAGRGGTLAVEPVAAGGTRVRLRIPLAGCGRDGDVTA